MKKIKNDKVREAVRKNYGAVAQAAGSGCGCASSSCCSPGGRLAVSDVVATAELPAEVKNDLVLHAGCVAGASLISDMEDMLRKAGFGRIRIDAREESRDFIREWAPGRHIEDFVVSATIEALKP